MEAALFFEKLTNVFFRLRMHCVQIFQRVMPLLLLLLILMGVIQAGKVVNPYQEHLQ